MAFLWHGNDTIFLIKSFFSILTRLNHAGSRLDLFLWVHSSFGERQSEHMLKCVGVIEFFCENLSSSCVEIWSSWMNGRYLFLFYKYEGAGCPYFLTSFLGVAHQMFRGFKDFFNRDIFFWWRLKLFLILIRYFKIPWRKHHQKIFWDAFPEDVDEILMGFVNDTDGG